MEGWVELARWVNAAEAGVRAGAWLCRWGEKSSWGLVERAMSGPGQRPEQGRRVAGDEWRVASGAWSVERGAWRVERGAWRVERGAWRVERGEWPVAGGAWHGQDVDLRGTEGSWAVLRWRCVIVEHRDPKCRRGGGKPKEKAMGCLAAGGQLAVD